MSERVFIKDLKDHIEKKVTICGWVDVRRDQGKMIFFDFRDFTGEIQGVILPGAEEAKEVGERVRPEWVVKVQAQVNKRPEKNIQADKMNGDIELEILSMEVFSEADTPPFDISTDGYEVNEELRMKYRYLDIRRPRMRDVIRNRHRFFHSLRDNLTKRGFTEVDTPYLTKSSPEGARDYVVPSRVYPGKFYALPQSPQQYKQLLMVGGVERYFQIARCMRDEDTRGDRQPEFTQLDVEMSFVSPEDIQELIEDVYSKIISDIYPDKKIPAGPWPRISYREVMEKYGTDKPDLRTDPNDPDELAFAWVVDVPLFEDEKTEGGYFAPNHHMFTAPREEDKLKLDTDPAEVISTQYDLILNGFEVAGGSVRIHEPDIQNKIFSLIGFTDEESKAFLHMLEAFRYGVPPHGGIASGLDRLLAVLENAPSIREVIPFPKTGEGRDLLMNAPGEISDRQLEELKIDIKKKKDDQ